MEELILCYLCEDFCLVDIFQYDVVTAFVSWMLFKQRRRTVSLPLWFLLSALSLITFRVRQWLLPREANLSHMFLTFILSNGPICLSKCVCCVLFPARFVPMPSLRWAPLSPGVWAEASRYLYRPNSWGPPSQSSEGWVEKLSWKLQV